jgi:hypothetical protein
MALKRKLDKTAFDALPDVLKAEYKLLGNDYVLDTDDASELKAAKDREVEARKVAEKAAKEAQAALDALTDKQNRENGDVAALDASYKQKLADLEKRATEAQVALDSERRDRYVSSEADKLAARFSVPSLMRGLIAKRLSVELSDGKPIVRVLDADGKPSANSLADLEKEFVDNPEYKGIVIGSKATGSAVDAKNQSTFGSANFNSSDKPADLSKLSPKDLMAHMDSKIQLE